MSTMKIEYDGKEPLEAVMRRFANQLPEKEILNTTAFCLNTVATRVLRLIQKEVAKEYTISDKYFFRVSRIKRAKGTANGLYAEVYHLARPLPLVAFKHTDNEPKGYALYGKRPAGVTVEVKRGSPQKIAQAFVAKMSTGHVGVFAHGSYKGSAFVPYLEVAARRSGKKVAFITQLRTASPFGMGTSDEVNEKVKTYVETNAPKILNSLLENKLKKFNTTK